MKKGQVDIITMGCSKNLVDSEKLMTLFEQAGYHCTHDAKRIEGEIVVINTCGFIEDAKQESIDTILELVQAKEEGKISKLFVMGCLSQRYQKELEEEIPQVEILRQVQLQAVAYRPRQTRRAYMLWRSPYHYAASLCLHKD